MEDIQNIPQTYPTIGKEEIAAFRRQFVMAKIIAGYTTDRQICDAWNAQHRAYAVTPKTIANDRAIAKDELAVQTTNTTRQVRDILSARLDTVIRALSDRVAAGELGATDRLLKAVQAQAQLWGANMPAKIAFTDTTGEKNVALMSEEERMSHLARLMERVKLRQQGLLVEETIIDVN